MRNGRLTTTVFSILLAALLGAIVTFALLSLLLVPLALLISIM